jgi:hypothetical protein
VQVPRVSALEDAMTTVASAPAQGAPTASGPRSIRIYEYSDMVYWWAIWFAALVAMLLTSAFGESIMIGDKAVKIHTSPWLGIGFLVIMFGVLIFTQLRARGIYAVIMILALAVIGLLVHMLVGWAFIWDLVTLVKVHMNMAYYVVVFTVSFALWVYVTFVHSRLTYGFVNSGEVGWRSPLTGQVESYRPLNFQVNKRSDDLIVHTLLGLRFLGLGTGDIEVKFDVPGGGSQSHVFKNVWRPDKKVATMERLIQDR